VGAYPHDAYRLIFRPAGRVLFVCDRFLIAVRTIRAESRCDFFSAPRHVQGHEPWLGTRVSAAGKGL